MPSRVVQGPHACGRAGRARREPLGHATAPGRSLRRGDMGCGGATARTQGLAFVVLDVHRSLRLQQQRDELCVAVERRMVQSREPGDRTPCQGVPRPLRSPASPCLAARPRACTRRSTPGHPLCLSQPPTCTCPRATPPLHPSVCTPRKSCRRNQPRLSHEPSQEPAMSRRATRARVWDVPGQMRVCSPAHRFYLASPGALQPQDRPPPPACAVGRRAGDAAAELGVGAGGNDLGMLERDGCK